MTYKEAMETAKRELGHPEKQIKAHSFLASTKYPSLENREIELLPGKTPRDLIDAIKKAFERVDALTTEEIELLNTGMQGAEEPDFSRN